VIVDVRTYSIKPGKMPHELDLYAKRGLAPQTRHLGPPLAYLHGESGDINALVHLWVFEDVADRARKRAAMMADPEWQTYLKLAANSAPFRSCSRSVVRDKDVTRAIRERAPIGGGSGPKLPGIATGSRHCIRQDLSRFGLLHSHRRSRLDTNCLEEAVDFASAWPRRPPVAAAPRPVLFPRGPAAPFLPGTMDEGGDRIEHS
jgi:NIPSNAP